MKYLLSFAIGAILGDIFFHLIPESIESHVSEFDDTHEAACKIVGLSVIAGIFMFIIVEICLQKWSCSVQQEPESGKGDLNEQQEPSRECVKLASNCDITTKNKHEDLKQSANENNNNNDMASDLNVFLKLPRSISDHENNNYYVTNTSEQILINRKRKHQNVIFKDSLTTEEIALSIDKSLSSMPPIHMVKSLAVAGENATASSSSITNLPVDPAGYLNLIANGFDNFTHGLAIGASFLVGTKVGLLTTFVIIIHEIPHEICDYAILVKSGFSRREAVKAQSSVSLFGIIGTALALYVKSIEQLNAKTVWILPFSAGGFLYIALVTLLPDILDKETDLRNSFGQTACVTLGIAFMGAVALL